MSKQKRKKCDKCRGMGEVTADVKYRKGVMLDPGVPNKTICAVCQGKGWLYSTYNP